MSGPRILQSHRKVALWIPAIYIIVVLEERELRDHCGKVYEDYCRMVPRFVPRLVGSKKAQLLGDSLKPN